MQTSQKPESSPAQSLNFQFALAPQQIRLSPIYTQLFSPPTFMPTFTQANANAQRNEFNKLKKNFLSSLNDTPQYESLATSALAP